ncbi:hypothetical protein TgHK011_008791 [Trichoderma gracile]|nr:hypothetical protein TgHK011_008791 [Trichoderma gracile]
MYLYLLMCLAAANCRGSCQGQTRCATKRGAQRSDPIEARANASVSASSRPKGERRPYDGEADGAAGPFISRCCDSPGVLRVWLCSTVLTSYLYDESPMKGAVALKNPRFYSQIARRPNGSVPSRQLPLVLDLLHPAGGVASKPADGQLVCDACLMPGILCGRRGNRVSLLWKTRQSCHDADLGAMENKLRRGTQEAVVRLSSLDFCRHIV